MADYWVSQAKKFCDFCKCWITDNKPSIQFHESGKKHKQNVESRIKEISRKSVQDQKNKDKFHDDIKKMEKEALKAYLEDSEANPDYTSQLLKERKQKNLEENETVEKMECNKSDENQSNQKLVDKKCVKNAAKDSGKSKVWYEEKSAEGYSYYWHIHSGESRWEPPEEGFLSVEEQKISNNSGFRPSTKRPKPVKKDKKAIKKEESSVPMQEPSVGPAQKPDPYGAWETIEHKIPEKVDFQLPEQEYVAIKIPTLSEKESKVNFKEKTVDTLNSKRFNEPEDQVIETQFKKRRTAKGNIRQRITE